MEKEPVVVYGIRFPVDLYNRIKELAKKEGRSFHSQVLYILRQFLERQGDHDSNPHH
jgi:predicted DNA-binding protein